MQQSKAATGRWARVLAAAAGVAWAVDAAALMSNVQIDHELRAATGQVVDHKTDTSFGFTHYLDSVSAVEQFGGGSHSNASQNVTTAATTITGTLASNANRAGETGSTTGSFSTFEVAFTLAAPANVRLTGSANGGDNGGGSASLRLGRRFSSNFDISVSAPGAVNLGLAYPNPVTLAAGNYGLTAFGSAVTNNASRLSDAASVNFVLIFSDAGGIAGDFNGSAQVEQGDLDLVLANWGAAFSAVPAAWVNQRPTEGIVDQAELDGVLANWGGAAASVFGGSSTPEPAAVVGLSTVGIIVGSRRRG